MRHIILALSASLALSACASVDTPLDEYQFGDLTATATELQAGYCATAEPAQRAVILAAMFRLGIDVPPGGACTDLQTLVPPVDLEGIDVEAAEQDRRRFEEMSDEGDLSHRSGDDQRAE